MSGSTLPKSKTPLLADSTYNKLKHTATIALPALAALYIALAQVWHFPRVEEVAASIAAINAFLGVLLGITSSTYNSDAVKYSGDLVVGDEPDGTHSYYVAWNSQEHADAVAGKDEATFKVTKAK